MKRDQTELRPEGGQILRLMGGPVGGGHYEGGIT